MLLVQVVPLYLAFGLGCAILLYALQRWRTPGALNFAAVIAAMSLWAFMYALELSSTSLDAQILFRNLAYIGAICIPVLYFTFVWDFARSPRQIPPALLLVFGVEAALAIVLLWTNDLHYLYYKSIRQVYISPVYYLITEDGAAAWVHNILGFALLSASSILLLHKLLHTAPAYRERALFVFFIILVPAAVGFVSFFGLISFSPLNLTPYSFLIALSAIYVGILRFNFLEVTTKAQQAVIENMHSPLMVIDSAARIVYANLAASDLFDVRIKHMIGKPVSRIWPAWPEVIRSAGPPDKALTRFEMKFQSNTSEAHQEQWFYPEISAVQDNEGLQHGTLVVWKEVETTAISQEAFRLGQERLIQFVQNSPNPIFALDALGKVRAWNPACASSFLYNEEILGTDVFQLFSDTQHSQIREKLGLVFENGRTFNDVDIEYIRKDGTRRFMATRLYPLLDGNGRTEMCIVANTDITDRMQYQETLRREFEELRVLHSVAITCAEATDVDDLIDQVTEIIGNTLYPDNFGVLLVNEDLKTIYSHRSYREKVADAPTSAPLEAGICGKVVQEGRPVRVSDVSQDPDYSEVDPATRSELCVPLKTSDRVIGVINAESDVLDAFDENDERLLSILAGQLASAIENARLFEAERAQRKLAEVLREIVTNLSTQLDFNELLENVLVQLERLIPYDAGNVMLLENNRIIVARARGYENFGEELLQQIRNLSFNIETTPNLNHLLETCQPYFITDLTQDPDWIWLSPNYPFRSWLGAPIIVQGDVIAIFSLDKIEAGFYQPEHAERLAIYAGQVGLALNNARLFDETQSRLREVTLLSKVIELTAVATDTQSALTQICQQVAFFFDSAQAGFFLLNRDTSHGELIAGFPASNAPPNNNQKFLIQCMESQIDLFLAERAPVRITQSDQDPNLAPLGEIMQLFGVMTAILVPIQISSQHAVVLGIEVTENAAFTAAEKDLMQDVANQISQSLERLDLFFATRDQAERMAELAVISRELNRSLTIQEVVQGIGKGAMTIGKSDRAAVFLIDENRLIGCAWSNGLPEAYIAAVLENNQPLPEFLIFESNEPLIISDVLCLAEDDPVRLQAQQESFRAIGVWPLIYEGSVIAGISLYHSELVAWSPNQYETFMAFTRQAAIALQNARLFNETKRRAIHQEALNSIITEAVLAPNLSHLIEVVLDLTMDAVEVTQGGLWVSGCTALRNIPEALGLSESALARESGQRFSETTVINDWEQFGPEDSAYPWAQLICAHGIRATLSVPVASGGENIGGLGLACSRPRVWLPDEIALVEAVGRQMGGAAERLELMRKTREQARQMQLVIDTVPEGVLLMDAQQKIIQANPAARNYLSTLLERVDFTQPVTTLAGQSIQDMFDPNSEPGWRELQSSCEPPEVFEIAVRPLEMMSLNAGWVLVLRDVTEERLALAHTQMQERLATVGQLAAGIAHDFNNIMAAIVVYSDLLAIDPNLNDTNREQIHIIQQQVQRATSLIRQILDFSRRSVMEPSPLDLLPFIKELDKLLARTLPENIVLRLSYQPGVYMIKADPTRLQQVFMNLALNARDAMPLGGVLQFSIKRLIVQEGERAPLVELTPGSWIQLSISDTGMGISENILPHIFDPFYTTKPPGKGTGLGLAQVYGIVKQHGGSIDVESTIGQGTVFRLFFPELCTHEVLPAGFDTQTQLSGDGEIVLLVEDDPTTREALQTLLESRNYSVYACADGLEALKLYEEDGEKINLVISDVVMPGMGGLTLYYALRSRCPDVKMLFITGHPIEIESQELLEKSHIQWLQKPFSVQDVLTTIQSIIVRPV